MSASATPAAPPALRRLFATRYVTALREGGSVPAVVEADDGALYVAKFRAAAQGGRVLAAEMIVGELARAAGLRVPELALIDIDAALGRSEPHQEIQELLIASAGLNLAMAYLAGAVGYDVAARRPVGGDARVGDRGAGRLRRQRRSHRAQSEPALACAASCGSSITAPRCTGTTAGTAPGRRERWPRRRRVRSRASASTCCCRWPTSCPRRARRWPRRWTTRRSRAPSAAGARRVAGRAGGRRAARGLRRLAARAARGVAGASSTRRTVSERRAFDYVIVQVVPRVDRDERLNAGVIVFCPAAAYLGCRIALDEARLRALAPDVDVAAVGRAARRRPRGRAPATGGRADRAAVAVRAVPLARPRRAARSCSRRPRTPGCATIPPPRSSACSPRRCRSALTP